MPENPITQAARVFGVPSQTVDRWLALDNDNAIADLDAATELLTHYLKSERIQEVVRRPVPNLEGRSLLDLLRTGDTKTLRAACLDMFRFDRVQG